METGAILVIILLAALVYGTVMWARRRKDRATEQARENATERVYRQEERQDQRELPS